MGSAFPSLCVASELLSPAAATCSPPSSTTHTLFAQKEGVGVSLRCTPKGGGCEERTDGHSPLGPKTSSPRALPESHPQKSCSLSRATGATNSAGARSFAGRATARANVVAALIIRSLCMKSACFARICRSVRCAVRATPVPGTGEGSCLVVAFAVRTRRYTRMDTNKEPHRHRPTAHSTLLVKYCRHGGRDYTGLLIGCTYAKGTRRLICYRR